MSKLFNVVMLSFMISLSLVNCVKTKEDYKKRNEIIQGITKAIYKKDNQLNCDGIKKFVPSAFIPFKVKISGLQKPQPPLVTS